MPASRKHHPFSNSINSNLQLTLIKTVLSPYSAHGFEGWQKQWVLNGDTESHQDKDLILMSKCYSWLLLAFPASGHPLLTKVQMKLLGNTISWMPWDITDWLPCEEPLPAVWGAWLGLHGLCGDILNLSCDTQHHSTSERTLFPWFPPNIQSTPRKGLNQRRPMESSPSNPSEGVRPCHKIFQACLLTLWTPCNHDRVLNCP